MSFMILGDRSDSEVIYMRVHLKYVNQRVHLDKLLSKIIDQPENARD